VIKSLTESNKTVSEARMEYQKSYKKQPLQPAQAKKEEVAVPKTEKRGFKGLETL